VSVFNVPGLADEQVFSGSSINTFMRCAKQWEYAYVYELKRPPSIRQVLGIAAHSAAELNYAQKIQSGENLPLDDVTDAFVTAFDAAAPDAEADREESAGEAKDSGVKAVTVYHEKVAPEVQPVWVEHEGVIDVDGIPYGYTIDLVDQHDRVRDLKNVKRKPTERGTTYLLSMVGYALGFRAEMGHKESEVVLDHIVRTQRPYHLPIVSDGPISDGAIGQFAGILKMVSQAIREGIFLPTGLQSHACSWCGYQDICEAYQSR
jgi:hypothetical protein